MDEKITVCSDKENGYTAKEAMQLAVEHMQAKTAHVISVIALEKKHYDPESTVFLKMFLRFLHKNRGRILLLAESGEMLSALEEYISENNARIRIVERAALEEPGFSDDGILNRINGAEAECIIAALPGEIEDQFLEKYQKALDALLWISLGANLKRREKMQKFQKLRKRFLEHFPLSFFNDLH